MTKGTDPETRPEWNHGVALRPPPFVVDDGFRTELEPRTLRASLSVSTRPTWRLLDGVLPLQRRANASNKESHWLMSWPISHRYRADLEVREMQSEVIDVCLQAFLLRKPPRQPCSSRWPIHAGVQNFVLQIACCCSRSRLSLRAVDVVLCRHEAGTVQPG